MKRTSRTYLFASLSIALLTALLVAGVGPSGRASAQSGVKRWVIIYHQQNSVPQSAGSDIQKAGGSVKALLPELGAAVAESSDSNFAAAMARDPKVSDVTEDVELPMIPTPEQMHAQVFSEGELDAAAAVEQPGGDAQTGSDTFYNPFQWDKKRIRASNQGSYAVQQGRPDVTVAVLDTGADILPVPHVDVTNPATGTNFDVARSRSFFPVQPNPNGDPNPAAWDDKHGHGSHCLSAVGAPINGIGMIGVAPKVRLVALKVLGDNGSGSLVSLAQALVYAGVNHFDVASMSLSAYVSHATNEPLIKLVQRAADFARSNGVTLVAALGNDSLDVSDGNTFRSFEVVPAELPGVIGVSATGYFNLKASYSNYGMGKTDVSAPGGDFAVQTPTNPVPVHAGSVIGAWATESCGFPNCYAFASGTSMACPNAAGVCALIISQYGDFTPDNSNKLHMSPQRVESYLQQTANNQPCPEPNTVNYFTVIATGAGPAGTQVGAADQRCQGDTGYNNFYGKGIVDAFKAVTQAPGQ
ncbi:MAG TPA: S8 family serine peptidase [Pyrinomonadaceae bacterium]|nr:S8 family serine peptidase [Pyrinomonadaceae bacterium]